MAGTIANVKFRVGSMIPSGITNWDSELTEALSQATNKATEMFTMNNQTFSNTGLVTQAIEDLAAAIWIRWHRDDAGDEIIEKANDLQTQAEKCINSYLAGTKKAKYFVGVNSVDSGVSR